MTLECRVTWQEREACWCSDARESRPETKKYLRRRLIVLLLNRRVSRAHKASSPVKGHRLRPFWIPALVCFALRIVVAQPWGFSTGIFIGSSDAQGAIPNETGPARYRALPALTNQTTRSAQPGLLVNVEPELTAAHARMGGGRGEEVTKSKL